MFKDSFHVIAVILFLAVGLIFAVVYGDKLQADFIVGGSLPITRVEGDGFPKLLVDSTDMYYQLEQPPLRVVSATLATDEILSELVDIKRIAGVTFLVDNPGISNVVSHYPDTITRVQGHAEEIIALNPDLVLIADYSRLETGRLLLSAGIPVVRLGAYNSYKDIFRNIETVGQVVGKEQKAQGLLNRLSDRIAMVKSKVAGQPQPRVLYFEMSGYTAGPGSLVDEMITLAGGFNVIRETGFRGSHALSQELAIGLEPDVIIVSGWSPKGERRPALQLMTNPVWQDVPAIKFRRVYDVPGSWAISNSQYSVEGLEYLAGLLHPEAF